MSSRKLADWLLYAGVLTLTITLFIPARSLIYLANVFFLLKIFLMLFEEDKWLKRDRRDKS